jgi:excisionase family DNA binding protein
MTYFDDGPLMTASEVAGLLRLKPSTVYDAALRGRIPCIRLWEGRRRAVVRFHRKDIERFLGTRRRAARPRA